jgi:hypothetical protein
MENDYQDILEEIMKGNIEYLDRIERNQPGFFSQKNTFNGDHWIIDAIDYGSLKVVQWMISVGASLKFKSETGYPALHTAIDSRLVDKYQILEYLILCGADLNERGVNDYTPAHLASVNNDVRALKILFKHGADFSIATRVDNCATPLEEARMCGGATDTVAFLRSL